MPKVVISEFMDEAAIAAGGNVRAHGIASPDVATPRSTSPKTQASRPTVRLPPPGAARY